MISQVLNFKCMPTRKRRIGFIPRLEVMNIIFDISLEEKISNSKVVNILIEEALAARGLIKKENKYFKENDFEFLIHEISDFKKIFSEDDFQFEKNEETSKSNKNIRFYKIFIQFLHFKKLINIIDKLS